MGVLDKQRRILTSFLTKGIQPNEVTLIPKNSKVKKVLIIRPNHRLGNQLLLSPLISELTEEFPDVKIDLFVKGGVCYEIFKTNRNVSEIYSLPKKHFKRINKYLWCWLNLPNKKYDIAINVSYGSSSGKLSTKICRAKYKVFGEKISFTTISKDDYLHMAKKPVYNLRKIIQKNLEKPVPNLNIWLSEEELKLGKDLLKKYSNNVNKTIAIFTYATGSKCYIQKWWNTFYESLRSNFPDYSIIEILPKENISQIDFKAPHYYSQDLREITAFIANCSIFIGADSGMMHLACASQTTTIGLFKVTNILKYEPYFNKNCSVDTNKFNQKEIIKLVREKLN